MQSLNNSYEKAMKAFDESNPVEESTSVQQKSEPIKLLGYVGGQRRKKTKRRRSAKQSLKKRHVKRFGI